jgi:hypothetical protein
LSAPVVIVSTGGDVGFAMCFQTCRLAGAEGIEPPTSGFGDQRSAN